MAQKIKKRCKVCGAEYEVCYSCDQKHSWKMHTDTEDHFYVFGVLMEYLVNHDVKQAYDALRKRGVDFHNSAGVLPSVYKLLDEIYTLAHENSRAKKVAVEMEESSIGESLEDKTAEQID